METNTQTQISAKPHKKRHIGRNIFIGFIILLLIVRFFLNAIVLHFLNKELAGLKEYYGHVEDVNIDLYRGAYVVKDMYLVKIEANPNKKTDTIPFFKVKSIDLSVEWKAIFKKRFVGEVYIDQPVVNFAKGQHKHEDVKADTADFRDLVKKMMPLKLNHFEIKNGEIHYIDKYSSPKVDVSMKKIDVVAENISNANDSGKVLPSSMHATADIYGGSFDLRVKFDGLAKQPTFEMKGDVKKIDLTNFNSMMKAYGNFTIKKGRLDVYTEFAGKQGKFGGYVKPLLKDFEVDIKGSFGHELYEMLIQGVANLITNPHTDKVGTKVNIEGSFSHPDVNIWRAVSFLLRNAFLQSIKPAVDNSIDINHLNDAKSKTFLERLFGSGKHSKKETDNADIKSEKTTTDSDKKQHHKK